MGVLRALNRKNLPPLPDLVAYLRELLTRAESGELRAVVVVAEDTREVTHKIVGEPEVIDYLRGRMLSADDDLREMLEDARGTDRAG